VSWGPGGQDIHVIFAEHRCWGAFFMALQHASIVGITLFFSSLTIFSDGKQVELSSSAITVLHGWHDGGSHNER